MNRYTPLAFDVAGFVTRARISNCPLATRVATSTPAITSDSAAPFQCAEPVVPPVCTELSSTFDRTRSVLPSPGNVEPIQLAEGGGPVLARTNVSSAAG